MQFSHSGINASEDKSPCAFPEALGKSELRKLFSERRRCISAEERAALSLRLCENVCSLKIFREANAVLSFSPLENETDVSPINEAALSLGKILALPRCVKGTRKMDFYTVRTQSDLEKGSFSVLEPKPDRPLFLPKGGIKALCIVPALAYDSDGFRLGYGGGYYDRYLSEYGRDLTVIGVAYGDFLTESLPHGELDVAVDAVVTDREILILNKESFG